jgi:carbamate kinase
MRICGVELTGNDAVVCLLNKDQGLFSLPDTKVRKLTLKKDHTRADLQAFQAELVQFLKQNDVERVVIKERMQKGKFAGGAISFKLEATIQLIAEPGIEIALLTPTHIKAMLSENPLPIAFADTGLKQFQEQAFITAYAGHYAR